MNKKYSFTNVAVYEIEVYSLCVAGKMYAMLLMKTVMVHILRQFEVKSEVRLEDIEYQLKVVLCTDNPLPIDFVHRENISVTCK